MTAYLLIQTATDAGPIASELEIIPGVTSAEDLRGPYDAIAIVGSTERPIHAIVPDVRRISGVTRVVPAPLTRSRRDRRNAAA